ncbi:MAG: hypothetical protein J6Q63_05735 [Bacteroidales bacterium]|nr:hypothetical protein [Bacteroidales bacterium]
MFTKFYDVFIAYHGSYDNNGSIDIAGELYEYLTQRNLKVFFFPRCGRDIYKANIIDVMKSKTFILICNEYLNTLENGKINPSFHYELSTEIDAFYALTQTGKDASVSESKILVCGNCNKGQESRLHELFANRTHNFLNEENREESYQNLYEWVCHRLKNKYNTASAWAAKQTTNEITEVFAKRSSMSQMCNLPEMVANAKSIRCLGISNTEMTVRIDPEAIRFALNNGADIEILFLDPVSEYTSQREKEEGTRDNKIKTITINNIEAANDLKDDLPDNFKGFYRLYLYDALPRMNLIIIDDTIILQYYANKVAGMSNPCFLIKRQNESPLYEFCVKTYESIKNTAKEII